MILHSHATQKIESVDSIFTWCSVSIIPHSSLHTFYPNLSSHAVQIRAFLSSSVETSFLEVTSRHYLAPPRRKSYSFFCAQPFLQDERVPPLLLPSSDIPSSLMHSSIVAIVFSSKQHAIVVAALPSSILQQHLLCRHCQDPSLRFKVDLA
jgi:hypothetical protein